MRNHLSKFSGLTENIQSQLSGLVYPAVLGDALQEPRHRSFLAGCLGGGAIALLILPLHLALIGPTSLPVALVLAWMLGQWPLAMYLSQTGNLERAHAFSASLFGIFLTGLCLFTGGLSSFALVWLAAVPMEAALSGSRRIIAASAAFCAGLVVLLAVVPQAQVSFALATPHATLISALAACAYMSVLALRLALDHMRVRKALQQGEERLKLLNDTATDIVCSVEPDGTAKVLGGPLETVLGLSCRQARGDWLFQRVHVSDRPFYLTRLDEARCGKNVSDVELRLRKGANAPGEDGAAEYIWVCLRFREMTSNEGDVSLRLALQDISARKAQDQELRQAKEMAEETSIAKTRFIASASHELRTPLNAIIGFSDMLRAMPAEQVSSAQNREYAELIHQSGMHLLQVVDDILDTSRIETGHMDLTIEPVDLGTCLESCRAMMAPIAERAGVELVFADQDSLAVLPADRRALKQIVINLVTNAIKFSGKGSTVAVSVRTEGPFQVLEVCDQGIGIPAEMIERLGQPFVRIEAEDSPRNNGSGLGLSIVKGLAELHGGALQVESRNGKGTTVSVKLPAGAMRAARAEPQSAGSNQQTDTSMTVSECVSAVDPVVLAHSA
ncbi:PAS domain-containing sensor histidine kinase [Roseibium polysiphoniae]|uniref:PAS domain-containing sensor histidine kinase n=1 Tax=Roseibium polysiphoniae TaxID=2571221 RepID=UPI001BCAA8F7